MIWLIVSIYFLQKQSKNWGTSSSHMNTIFASSIYSCFFISDDNYFYHGLTLMNILGSKSELSKNITYGRELIKKFYTNFAASPFIKFRLFSKSNFIV